MIKTSRYAMCAAFVAVFLLAVAPLSAQESGAEMWGRACGRCHRALPPTKYDADAWRAIMGNMALNARLTPQEQDAITEFLMASARPLVQSPGGGEWAGGEAANPDAPAAVSFGADSSSPARGATAFGSHCKVCHGEEGKGDGPAASALTPRPSDLTRSERVRTMSDEALIRFLSNGKGSMPGFGNSLTAQQLRDVAAWLRTKNNP